MRSVLPLSVLLLLALVPLAGCQMAIDPATGQRQVTWTLPGTQANADAAVQAWQQCTQFASQSYCARTLPNGQPPGVTADSWENERAP